MAQFIHPNDIDFKLAPGRSWTDEAVGFRVLVDARLGEICSAFSAHAPPLGLAMAEAVLAPGKRFRAVVMLMLAERTGGVSPALLDAACALELIHSASLVIDDLPAMDGATLRRGRPTTHRAHGEGRAILAGIALVSEAFRVVAAAPGVTGTERSGMVSILAEALGPAGLCAGQDLDLYAPKTMQSVGREQDLKTGVLFAAICRMIALLQRLTPVEAARLASLGGLLGRTFQSFDDLLDIAGSPQGSEKSRGLDRARSGYDKGLLAVSDAEHVVDHYVSLREALGFEISQLWFDARNLRDYVLAVLPLDPGAHAAAGRAAPGQTG